MTIVFILMLVHLTILTMAFIADETSIDVRIAEARELEFPAVTVCNANPIKKSALEAVAGNNPLLQQLLELDGPPSDATNKKRISRNVGFTNMHRNFLSDGLCK